HRGKARFPSRRRDQLRAGRAVAGTRSVAVGCCEPAPGAGLGVVATGLLLVLTAGLALVLTAGLALTTGAVLRLVAPGAIRLSLVWRGASNVLVVAAAVGVVCTFTALVTAGVAAVAPAPACCCWICAARLGAVVVACAFASPPTWVPPSGVGTRPPIRVKPICSAVGVLMPRPISCWRAASRICATCAGEPSALGVNVTVCEKPFDSVVLS